MSDALPGFNRLREIGHRFADLAALFDAHQHPLYLVGGSVRDAFLDRGGMDYDFTTSARPELIMQILQSYAPAVWDTGIEFGTVSAEKDDAQIEITTFRSDTYDGSSRNPEVRFGDSLEGDLVRRDFKVNAMAVRITPGGDVELHDPMEGLSDLQAGLLDTPATPEQSFHDDPLRMLRAARFVSQLECTVAPRVQQAMTEMSGEITRITAERVQMEMSKLMLGRAPWAGIDVMVESGLADHVLPEVPALRLTQDEHKQHKDVYVHSKRVLRNVTEHEGDDGPDLVLRWAALMHDIGKPATREFHEGGAVSFHQHEVVGAKMVRQRLRALKYPKQVVKDVSQLVFLHMRFYGYSDAPWSDSGVRRYANDAGELLPQLNKLVRSDCTTRNKRKSQRLKRAYDELEQRIADLAEKENLAAVRPDLNGNDIMEILELPPGPEVGRAWSYLKELRLDQGPMERDDAIAALRSWWQEQN
ncbi:CCA tRNA nucleotidyltransferase [Corynebacterium sp. 11A]|uniref:CCA tRNA nucleotidyltransferase n=1 Tax=Corynebacterium sp. 11A TaxID=2080510 RepID=UPI00124CB579|nr:CCA tRNA nucleotidyltransferase [Corynebacterium sp. 11A]